MEKSKTANGQIQKFAYFGHSLVRTDLQWGASSRWLFRPNSAWCSIETMTIGKTHPTLFQHLHVKQLEDQPLLEDFPLAVKKLMSYLLSQLILIFLVRHQIQSRRIEQAKFHQYRGSVIRVVIYRFSIFNNKIRKSPSLVDRICLFVKVTFMTTNFNLLVADWLIIIFDRRWCVFITWKICYVICMLHKYVSQCDMYVT